MDERNDDPTGSDSLDKSKSTANEATTQAQDINEIDEKLSDVGSQTNACHILGKEIKCGKLEGIKKRYKSRAQKRKRRALRETIEKEMLKKQKTLFGFNFSTPNAGKIDDTTNNTTEVSDDQKCDTDSQNISGLSRKSQNSFETQSPHDQKYDIGTLKTVHMQSDIVNEIIRCGHAELPAIFPRDRLGNPFSLALLSRNMPNGETMKRAWLVWSSSMDAFYCLPCRLFNGNSENNSKLCCPEGYSKNETWKKLYEKLPAHEKTAEHIQCCLKLRLMQNRIEKHDSLDTLHNEHRISETKKWQEILQRILDTILFIAERGLALSGESELLGQPNNGNFLGILELISHYDRVLSAHLEEVRSAQLENQLSKVPLHLSIDMQNQFIDTCAQHVISAILEERKKAKYFAIIIHTAPDIEEHSLILRYLKFDPERRTFTVQERFLCFIDCYKKTGAEITDLICDTLQKYNIPLNDCCAQGYDSRSNMKLAFIEAQNKILQKNPKAVYAPYAAQSLNLGGAVAAECCSEAINFFGIVEKCFNIFSSSEIFWDILKKHVPDSLQNKLSEDITWPANIEAVKAFENNIEALQNALEDLKRFNLTAVALYDINGILEYINNFECILMSFIWYRILRAINERSRMLQVTDATIDMEVIHLEQLLYDLQLIRQQWDCILGECETKASALNIPTVFPTTKKRKGSTSLIKQQQEDLSYAEAATDFKSNTFLPIMDSVIAAISQRFAAIKNMDITFSFLWQFPTLYKVQTRISATNFVNEYKFDISQELVGELIYLKHIYEAKFETATTPLLLLNAIFAHRLSTIFPYVCIALRLYCTIPVTVVRADCPSFLSVVERIKRFHRSYSTENGDVSGLATLCIEARLAKQLHYDDLIRNFAGKTQQMFISNFNYV